MKILVLGSGARENTIIQKVRNPGNQKIQSENRHEVFQLSNSGRLPDTIKFCRDNRIGLVVFGGEASIMEGYVDCMSREGFRCFGPTLNAAMIEGSKLFAKDCMKELNIPTAKVVDPEDTNFTRYVIKRDGLASGKGVFIPDTHETLNELRKRYDDLFCEERLEGEEISVMAFCDGLTAKLMPQIKDFKRLYDFDKGPNTGGMGAVGPVNILSNEELLQVRSWMMKIVQKLDFRGVLYAGLMKTVSGIKVLEFNCRFGDPECQIALGLLKTDLVEIMNSCINGTLELLQIEWKCKFLTCVNLVDKEYPAKKSNLFLPLPRALGIVTTRYLDSGRLVSIIGESLWSIHDASEMVYNYIATINQEKVFFRRDIDLVPNKDKSDINKLRIGILGSTKGTSIEKLLRIGIKPKVIVSSRSGAPILDKAKKYKIPFIFYPGTRDLLGILKGFNLDVILLVGYMKFIQNDVLDYFGDRIVNIHPSLLPKYKGLMDVSVHEEVLKHNETFTGCTLHVATEEVDSGRIIFQRQLKISEFLRSDADILKQYVQDLESDCIIDFLKLCAAGEFRSFNTQSVGTPNPEETKYLQDLKPMVQDTDKYASYISYGVPVMTGTTDGVGSKIHLVDNYTAGIDCVAMCVNDLLADGTQPITFFNYLSVDSFQDASAFLEGIKEGCGQAGCIIVGGETSVTRGSRDIAGFAVGKKIYDQYKPGSGDVIYGIASTGMHSNGFTTLSKIFRFRKPENMDSFLKPTKIYLDEVKSIWSKNIPFRFANVTGGGVTRALNRVCPDGFELDEFETDVFKWIRQNGGLTRNQMLNEFNCGIGFIVIIPKYIDPVEEYELDFLFKIGKVM